MDGGIKLIEHPELEGGPATVRGFVSVMRELGIADLRYYGVEIKLNALVPDPEPPRELTEEEKKKIEDDFLFYSART